MTRILAVIGAAYLLTATAAAAVATWFITRDDDYWEDALS